MVRTYIDLVVLVCLSEIEGLLLSKQLAGREKRRQSWGKGGRNCWIDDDFHTKSLDLARLRESLGETLYSNFLLTHNT